jgi:hypothetical protein
MLPFSRSRREIPAYKWILRCCSLAILVFISLSPPCFACSCRQIRSECQLLDADAIFVGKVIETVPTKHLDMDKHSSPGYSMRFTVEKSLRGKLGKEVTVETGWGGGDCGTPLDRGKRFLIFAVKGKGKLWTGLCSGNQLLTNDSEIETIVAPVRKAITIGKGSLFGTVTFNKATRWEDKIGEDPARGVPGVIVHAVSATKTATTHTANDGTYRFEDLPNGIYTITPEVQQDWAYDGHRFPRQFERIVFDGSCRDLDVRLHPSTRLKGQVTTKPGRVFGFIPEFGYVVLLKVVATPISLQNTNEHNGTGVYTDESGHFDVWPIPPGDYYVGINITSSPTPTSPYTPTYYPGVTDKKAARVVHIDEGETKYIKFPLPDFAQKRVVHFVAIGLDGKPLRKVRVQWEDLQHPGDAINTVDVDLDANGSGAMNVYSGFTYHLHASYVWLYRTTWCAEPVLVPAGSEPVNVRFVMDRSDSMDERFAIGRNYSTCDIVAVDNARNDLDKHPKPLN